MKKYVFILFLGFTFFCISCSNTRTNDSKTTKPEKKTEQSVLNEPIAIKEIKLNDSIKLDFIQKGSRIRTKAMLALQQKLLHAMKIGGPEYAISFCNEKAIQITDSVSSAEKVIIRRLAKKNRNPVNAMSDKESDLYKTYVIQFIGSQQLKPTIGLDEQRRPVYYQPIFTGAVCLNCHGKPGKDINPQVAEKIAQLYPDDKAIDFKLGQIRGMWAITFPNYKIMGVEQ
jgi:hypothetical protein